MSGLVSSPTGLWGGRPGLFGTTGLSTSFGLLADVASAAQLSLYLDFLTPTYQINGVTYSGLEAAGITFSRGTNATLIDSTGQLTYAPSNQIPNSESFTALVPTGTWAPTGLATIPVVSNATVAPDGTTTADSIVEDTANSTHRIDYSGLAGNAGKYAASVYLKAGTRTFARIQFDATLNAVPSSAGVQIDLSDGTPSSTTVAGNITAATATSEFVGNGWYRLGLIFTISPTYVLSGGSVRIYLMQSLAPAPSYLGNGSNIFVWGAQFGAMTYETAPRAYNSTTPKNLLGFTEEFENAVWTKANATVTANAIADPNGYLNADKLVETTSTSTHHITQTTAFVSETVYTWNFFVKAAERSVVRVLFPAAAFTTNLSVNFDIATGAWRTSSPTPPAALTLFSQDAGNGWYRISATAKATASVSSTILLMLVDSPSGTGSYTGDGTSGAYIWGAQLSDSASVDPYVYNPAAALTSTAYYGPRFDYDPAFTYSDNNLIPYANPQDFSNASFWSKVRASAPATTATVDPAGTYTAYKLTEDNTAANSHFIAWQGVGRSVTAGVQYTFSGYAKAAERTAISPILGAESGAFAVSSGGDLDLLTGNVTNQVGSGLTAVDVGNGWYRWSITATAVISAAFAMRVNLLLGGTNTYNGDGTSGAYIWGAQLVTGAAAVPFFYYPPLGLLIEEARTNLLLQSEQLDVSATWVPLNGTVTANTIISPDGTTNADAFIESTLATSFHAVAQTITKAASNIQYTVTIYAKAKGRQMPMSFNASGSGVAGRVDLDTGTVVSGLGTFGTGWTAGSLTITPAGNGWYRVVLVATSNTATTAQIQYSLYNTALATNVYTGDGVSGVYLWGAQLEAAGFATSYIPTVAASATRSADVATMVGNNFSNWYSQTAGTISVSVDTVASSSITAPVLSFQDAAGSATSRHQIATYTTCSATVLLGATQSNIGVNTLSSPKLAYAYQDNNFAFSANGTTTIVDTTGTVPLNIGYATLGKWDFGSASSLNGHIKTVSYYNVRLSYDQIQALTA